MTSIRGPGEKTTYEAGPSSDLQLVHRLLHALDVLRLGEINRTFGQTFQEGFLPFEFEDSLFPRCTFCILVNLAKPVVNDLGDTILVRRIRKRHLAEETGGLYEMG